MILDLSSPQGYKSKITTVVTLQCLSSGPTRHNRASEGQG